MKTWFMHHKQALLFVLSRLLKNKLSTLFICLSIGVTLALPSLAYIVLNNLNSLVSSVKSESKLSVFLTANTNKELISSIENTLKQTPTIENVVFVSKKEALEQLIAADSNKSILDSLQENPLPDAFFIEPKMLDAKSVNALKVELSKIKGVEAVLVDDAWIKRLNYLLLLGKKILIIVATLLGFALIAVIGNTIRMQILTQQAEIELSQLIGATNSFIRRPFLYLGALYGLGGGIMAIMFSTLIILLLNKTIIDIAISYQIDFKLSFFNNYELCSLLMISCAIGLSSAFLSVQHSFKITLFCKHSRP